MSGLRLWCALVTMFLLTECQSNSRGQKRQEVDDAMQYLEDLDRVYSVHVRPRFGKRSGALKQDDDARQYLADLDKVYSTHVRPRFGKREDQRSRLLETKYGK